MSNHYNGLFKTRFRGCEQIGYVDTHDKRVHLRVFKLPDTDELVGIFDGIDCWVANPKQCLFGMKRGTSPDHPPSHLTCTRNRVNVQVSTTRKKLLSEPVTEPNHRRRLLQCQ